jgi:gliding motility-associated-like protein
MVFAEYSRSFFADATMGTDNKFGAVGQNFGYVDDGKYGSRDFSFLKVDTVTSEQFCFYNGTDYTLAEEPINRLDFQYNTDSSLSITPGLATPFTTVDAYIQTRYTCPDYIDSCSFMKISGPTAMCSISDIYTYRVHRNRKCTLQPKWILSPGISIVNQTDSTLSVRFPGLGNYKIISVLLGCVPIKDSLIITLASTTLKPDLGNDTVICNNTIIPLHAGKGFLTYRWMDGTTDPVLNAKQSGIYWVEVTDSCSNILRDSILISPFNLAINIGPDRKKCNNDTLHLNAPDGFLNYEWSNNYNISATNTQLVVVNPLTDTLYYLKAEKLPGCFAYDTVGIKVKISPSIQLGPDKSFCKGDSAWLNAGAGFAQYHWSNGTSAQQILVFNTGIYSIIATTAAGCKSYDTLNILNVWTNPVVRLDHNPDLCKGATRTLQAGNYSSYLWQDGSTSSSFIAKAVGTYYVTVTDSYQCKGRDTVWIVRLLPLPANFLPADTAICSYGEVVLNTSQTYSTYLWSNGNTGAATTITQPGLYWLQVTDANSCAGKDSVIVLPKDCMKGVYVPTAFSPNQDGKNDVFKPLIFGDVKSFQWVVYNRFGQIVFSTDNVSKGWDGTVKGIPQNTGGFTWVCHYQFAGEAARVKSGAVLLIR